MRLNGQKRAELIQIMIMEVDFRCSTVVQCRGSLGAVNRQEFKSFISHKLGRSDNILCSTVNIFYLFNQYQKKTTVAPL